MHRLSIEQITKLGLNRYEAVIVASQHARSLNNKRLRSLEKMEEKDMVALKDLLEGRVKFTRSYSM